jgi:S1-C subfamily serine protease
MDNRRRAVALAFLLSLEACGMAEGEPRLVTLSSPEGTGLGLRELPGETLRSIGLSCGMAVIKAGPGAERAGLRIGDVVYGVNQTRARNAQELGRLLAQPHDKPPTLLVRRGQTDFYVDLGSGVRSPAAPATDTPLRT